MHTSTSVVVVGFPNSPAARSDGRPWNRHRTASRASADQFARSSRREPKEHGGPASRAPEALKRTSDENTPSTVPPVTAATREPPGSTTRLPSDAPYEGTDSSTTPFMPKLRSSVSSHAE